MSYVIKISEAGKEVGEATIDELVLKSVPSLSVKDRIQLSVTSGASGPGSNSYPHGYGYIPQMLAFTTTSDLGDTQPESYINVPQTWYDTYVATYSFEEDFNCYANTTSVTITAETYYWIFLGDWEKVWFQKTYTFDILLLMEEALLS